VTRNECAPCAAPPDRRRPSDRISRTPIVATRIRRIEGSFAFLPHRFLRQGFFASLTKTELALYVFLVLVSDRDGLSFYSYDRICSTLEIVPDDYLDARNGLLDKDLIAFDGTRFQVLSLPDNARLGARESLRSAQDLELHDPATIRQLAKASLRGAPGK
jgi:hypothetical protein